MVQENENVKKVCFCLQVVYCDFDNALVVPYHCPNIELALYQLIISYRQFAFTTFIQVNHIPS